MKIKVLVLGISETFDPLRVVGYWKNSFILAELACAGHEIEYRQIGKTVGEPDLVWYDECARLVEPVKIKPSKGPRDRWGKVK